MLYMLMPDREVVGVAEETPSGSYLEWLQSADLCIARVESRSLLIETTFLPADHSLEPGRSNPVLWQTVVTRCSHGEAGRELGVDRCSGNYNDALAMHKRMADHWVRVFTNDYEAQLTWL